MMNPGDVRSGLRKCSPAFRRSTCGALLCPLLVCVTMEMSGPAFSQEAPAEASTNIGSPEDLGLTAEGGFRLFEPITSRADRYLHSP